METVTKGIGNENNPPIEIVSWLIEEDNNIRDRIKNGDTCINLSVPADEGIIEEKCETETIPAEISVIAEGDNFIEDRNETGNENGEEETQKFHSTTRTLRSLLKVF
ncbi:hypothetical protein JTB14_034730 [Gonioctena quinquepunctata]|nr:hypothetical protein JTB14_034730 [Gonioctena quinquepunctata]